MAKHVDAVIKNRPSGVLWVSPSHGQRYPHCLAKLLVRPRSYLISKGIHLTIKQFGQFMFCFVPIGNIIEVACTLQLLENDPSRYPILCGKMIPWYSHL